MPEMLNFYSKRMKSCGKCFHSGKQQYKEFLSQTLAKEDENRQNSAEKTYEQ